VAEAGSDWLLERARALHALLEERDYRGHDPFDLANSPYLSRLSPDRHLPHLALSKFGARLAPDAVRRILRVPPIEDPKTYACAYFGYRLSGLPEFAAPADLMLDRLAALAGDPERPSFWGYDYLWATRGSGVNPRRASTIVPGSFAMLALMHGMVSSGDDRHAELLRSAVRHYGNEHRCSGDAGEFLGYFPRIRTNTHNANLLGCLAVTVGGRLFADDEALASAASAARTSVAAVRADGFIPYRDRAAGDWTDCFHHLYVLGCVRALASLNPHLDRSELTSTAERLDGYYRRHFRRPDGGVNFFPDRLHPIDPHNHAAVAIHAVLSGEGDLDAERLLRALDQRAWDERRGRYIYRIHRHRRDRRLFLRWTQAWMFAAVCIVLGADGARASIDDMRDALLREPAPV
jgi:hypothetical protein